MSQQSRNMADQNLATLGITKRFLTSLRDARESRITLVIVVTMALFLDDFMLSVTVPILPVVFMDQCNQDSFPDEEGFLNWSLSGSETVMRRGKLRDDHALSDCEKSVNTRVGILLGSQFISRVFMSLFASCMSNAFGYYKMMVIGCFIMLLSTIVYSIADTYVVYFLARLLHGIAAIPNTVGAMSLLAYRFRDNDEKRGFVLGIAVTGFAVGNTAGPPFGGIVLFYFGKTAPFIFSAGMIGILLLAEIFIRESENIDCEKEDPSAILKLLLDWRMLVICGTSILAGSAYGLLEPSLPVWMISTMNAEDQEWQLGAVFLPSGLATILGSVILGYFGHKIGRWLCNLTALLVMAVSFAVIPMAKRFWMLLPPMAVFGFAFGVLESVSCSIFNNLAEQNYHGSYSGAATLYMMTFAVGLIVGPAISAVLLNYVSFRWMLWLLGILLVCFAPLCISLRDVEKTPSSDDKNEKMTLIIPTHKPEIFTTRQT